MIRGGHERARRNLYDTWALMRSPPLVTLGPSGLATTLRAATSPGQPGSSTRFASHLRVIHQSSTREVVRAPCDSARLTSGRGVKDVGLTVKAREDQAAADQLRSGDDVRVGDAPGDLPVRLHGERLDLGLEEHVGETRRAEKGDQRGRRPMHPPGCTGRAVQAVAWKPYATTRIPAESQ